MLPAPIVALLAHTTQATTTQATTKPVDPPDDPVSAATWIWATVVGIWHGFLAHIPLIIGALLVLIITGIVASLVKTWLRRFFSKFDFRDSLKELLNRLIRIAIWITGILIAAMVLFPNLTPASALTALGLGTVAIGFAFKDIFENFFAGILILWRFPIEKGDFLEVEGQHVDGQVEEINIRNTHIRTVSDELIVVPNALLYKNPVKVLTNRPIRRDLVIAGVDYDDDLDKAAEIIRKAVEKCETVSDQKKIQVLVTELGASSVNFEVAWWTRPTPLSVRESRDEVIRSVKRDLDNANITIPFPQRTHSFKDTVPFQRMGGNGNGNGNGSGQAEGSE
ncbi:MAG: mechanosensitive ion channel family protein [Phycisphaerae bacterium]